MTDAMLKPVPKMPVTMQDEDDEIRETQALTSWSTTRPELDASPLMKAFVRLNVYLYSKPPSPVQTSINKFFLRMNVWIYRKTGKERVTPVAYLYEQGRFVIVAVPGHFDIPGGPKATHPAWYLNLRANPEAVIDIGPEQIEVTAKELTGTERARQWHKFTSAYPFIGEFANRAKRPLPLLQLTPKDLVTDNDAMTAAGKS